MDCPLNVLDLPVIGEISHIIGDCYCYLCTCGSHLCPSNVLPLKISAKNSFSSMYATSYSPKPQLPQTRYIRKGELLHSKQKMELTTTQRSTYQPYETDFARVDSIRSNSSSPFKSTTRSTYSANYPDWKFYEQNYEKSNKKYEKSPLKFTAVSTYGNDFASHGALQAFTNKGKRRVNSLIGAKNSPTGTTTSQFAYRPYKVESIEKKQSVTDGEIYAKGLVSLQTTYKEHFLPSILTEKLLTKKELNKRLHS